MVSVLRPGQRIINIPGFGVTMSRRAVSAGAEPEPYLLNFANYSYNGGARTLARDFTVTVDAFCLGARFKGPTNGTCNIRLWRTDTQAELASVLGVASTKDAEKFATFAAPVALSTALTYRISIYNVTDTFYQMWYGTTDHPDGAVTILTSTAMRYGSTDVYPNTSLGAASTAIEPTIQV